MPDHVAIGEVDDDKGIFLASQGLDHGGGHLGGAHLRFEIVGLHPGRGDQIVVLARQGLALAAVEVESNVRVFLGLGAMELADARVAQDLAQGDARRLVMEGNGHLIGLVVAHHAGHLDRPESAPLEMAEIRLEEGAQGLAGPVLAEVEGEQTVSRLDPGPARDAGGQDEFIVLPRGIGLLDGRPCRIRLLAQTLHQAAPCLFGTVPAVVAIHGVVAAGDTGDHAAGGGQGRLDLRQIAQGGARGGIPAIGDHVDGRDGALLAA